MLAKKMDSHAVWRQQVVADPPAVELEGSVTYAQGWAIAVPAAAGVYLISDLRGCLYIGRTTNLSTRFQQHFWGSHNRQLTTALRHPVGPVNFSWVRADQHEINALEERLIRALQPLCNKIRYAHTNAHTNAHTKIDTKEMP